MFKLSRRDIRIRLLTKSLNGSNWEYSFEPESLFGSSVGKWGRFSVHWDVVAPAVIATRSGMWAQQWCVVYPHPPFIQIFTGSGYRQIVRHLGTHKNILERLLHRVGRSPTGPCEVGQEKSRITSVRGDHFGKWSQKMVKWRRVIDSNPC